MRCTLGLDIGISSIGWAVLRNMPNGEPFKIEDLDALLSSSGFEKDVYTLRAEGLDRPLTRDEWARVLLHLTQRRGYRSNSTAEAAADWREMRDSDFLFSLYAGDLIRVVRKKPIVLKAANKESSGEPELLRTEWMLYFSGADISTASITGASHDRKYLGRGIGIKALQTIEKYEVDPLDEYHKVHTPEKRQAFR